MQDGYGVSYVDDDELPAETDWLFVKTGEGGLLLCIKEHAVSPEVLEEAWAAYRQLANDHVLVLT